MSNEFNINYFENGDKKYNILKAQSGIMLTYKNIIASKGDMCLNNLLFYTKNMRIMDLYSRKIIAWVLSNTLEAKWLIEAIEKVKKTRHVTKLLIMHLD